VNRSNSIAKLYLLCAVALLLFSPGAYAQQSAGAQKQTEVYGQKIHYLEVGSGGPNVILLHGLGADSSSWALTAPALADRFHVYAPDQIGFGQSDKPKINYRVGTMVDFLYGFMKQLNIDRATLVGNSLGGWIALAFALAHPDRVQKIVLVDSAGISDERLSLSAPELLRRLNPSTLAGTREALQNIVYDTQMITDQVVENFFVARLKKGDSYTIDKFLESVLRGEDFLDGKLSAIRAPTLIIWGREDKLTPLTMGEQFAREIKGAELVVFDKCGHIPQIEKPAQFNAALLKFLSQSAASN